MTARHAGTMGLPVLALFLATGQAMAQDVRADIRIATGAVAGRVVIGERREVPARVVVIDREPRVIVERRGEDRVIVVDEDRRRAHRQHARHHNRHVRGFWDPRSNQFSFERWHPRMRAVTFCEHGKKYHLIDGIYDDDYDRGRRRGW